MNIVKFSTECLTVTKLENSIILLAFRSGLNDESSHGRRFKEDDGWINIHNIDDVTSRKILICCDFLAIICCGLDPKH